MVAAVPPFYTLHRKVGRPLAYKPLPHATEPEGLQHYSIHQRYFQNNATTFSCGGLAHPAMTRPYHTHQKRHFGCTISHITKGLNHTLSKTLVSYNGAFSGAQEECFTLCTHSIQGAFPTACYRVRKAVCILFSALLRPFRSTQHGGQ